MAPSSPWVIEKNRFPPVLSGRSCGTCPTYRPLTAVRRYLVECCATRCYAWIVDRDRFDYRMRVRSHSGLSGMVAGALIVAVGLIILLDNLGIVRVHDVWRFWPVILIGVGLSRILESRGPGGQVWGGLMVLVGAAFLLDNLHILVFDFDVAQLIWPLAIIGFGVFMLLRAMDRKRALEGLPAASTASSVDGVLGSWAIFSSVKRKVDSQDFKGCEATAVFGEVKIDLRKAGMTGDQAVIDVNALFGGVDIRVPENWRVEMKGAGIFGAFEDKTVPPRSDPGVKTPQLIITGTAVFGAAKVDN
jgi:predicted membrane protein